MVEVHRQEGDFRRNIGVPEPVDELDTVVDADILAETDMRRVQVAVTVVYLLLRHTLAEQGVVVSNKVLGIGLDATKGLRLDNDAEVSLRLLEVLRRILDYGLDAPKSRNFLARCGFFMKICEYCCYPLDHLRRNFILLEQDVHHFVLGKSAHLDRVFFSLTPPP